MRHRTKHTLLPWAILGAVVVIPIIISLTWVRYQWLTRPQCFYSQMCKPMQWVRHFELHGKMYIVCAPKEASSPNDFVTKEAPPECR
jgi:hypothetical protein